MRFQFQINVSAPVLARNRKRQTNDRPIIVRTIGAKGGEEYQMAQGVRILDSAGHVVAELKHGSYSVWLEADRVELVEPVPGLDQ